MRRFLIAFFSALLLAPAAYADDFTFTVPVCSLYTQATPSLTVSSAAQGQSDMLVFTAGNYNAPVRVVVNLGAGIRRDSMHSYRCVLAYWATTGGRGRMVSGNTPEEQAADYTTVTGQAITSANTIITGTLP